MDVDAREQRLRAGFGWMMVWTAAAVWILGDVLGQVLLGAGSVLGYALDETGATAVRLSGHPVVGVLALVALFRTYLKPVIDVAR